MTDTPMTMPCLFKVLAGLCACLGNAAAAIAGNASTPVQTVAACDDANELPPFSYYERIDGKKTATVTGYSTAVLLDIFTRRN